MRPRFRSFRRKVLWRLLCGAMGGVACAGEIRAADSPGTAAGASVEAPSLRLTLMLGSTRKPARRPPPTRAAGPAAEAGLPLRMTLALVPRSGGSPQDPGIPPARAAVPGAAIASSRAGGGERIGVSAGGPASGRQDEDADEQPAPGLGSAAPPVGAAPPRQPSPVARDAAPAAGTDVSGLPDLEGLTWQMAPIRWTGNTGTQVNSFIGEDGATIMGITNNFNLNANSFIVAPWLGKWTAGFGRATGNTTSSGTGVKVKSESGANVVSGGLSLVPTSNFPFNANFNHNWSDARVGRRAVGLGNGDASATTYSLEQKYRTNGGRDNYSASYSGGILRSGQEKNEFSALRGDYSTRREFEYEHFLEGVHLLSASVNYVPESAVANGGKARLVDGGLAHNWKVHEDLTIDNRLTMRNSSLDGLQGNALQRNDSTYLLGTTSFSWRPFEEEPLILQGGATLWTVQTDTGIDTPIEQDNFAAYLSGTYTFNKNLTANAGMFAASTSSNQTASVASSDSSRINTLNGNVGANYMGDPLQLGSYFYNWNVGGGLRSRFDNLGMNAIEAVAAGSHSVSKTIVIDPRQSVGLNAGQGLAFSTSSKFGSTSALTHNAGGNWNANYGEALSASVAATINHSIANDDISSNVQSLGISATGSLGYRHQFSARANASVTGVLNWYRSQSDNVQSQTLNQLKIDSSQTTYNANLIATYTHIAPFSVPNLFYIATLFVNFNQGSSGIATIRPGNVSASVNAGANVSSNTSTTLQQNLRYRIGRLSFNANAAAINTDNGINYSLFGSMNREFDGFFDGRW